MLTTVLAITSRHVDYSELHCAAITNIDITISTTPGMTGFLDLSREIRDMIYNLCLVTDKVIVPSEEYYPLDRVRDLAFRNSMPTVALLGVSKLVGAEAAEVLYGNNTWRIASEDNDVWIGGAELFRHIVLVFDQRDIEPIRFQQQLTSEHRVFKVASENSPALNERRQISLHDFVDSCMEETWLSKFEVLSEMSNLATVKIDVCRLFCWSGCCRGGVLNGLLETFRRTQQHQKRNQESQYPNFYLQGIFNQKEEDIVRGYGFFRNPKSKVGVLDITEYWMTTFYLNYEVLRQT